MTVSQAIRIFRGDNWAFTPRAGITPGPGDPKEEQKQFGVLLARRVDGILAAPVNLDASAYQGLDDRLSVVLFDRFPAGYVGSAVMVDNIDASRRGMLSLLSAGHTRIALIAGSHGILTTEERIQGAREALNSQSVPLYPEYVKIGDFNMQGGYRAAKELMQLSAPPTAIFAHNYEMTLGLMRALKELKIGCPSQVSVLGFDDFVVGVDGFSWATMFSPELSCIAQPSYDIGRRAASALIHKLNWKAGNPPIQDEVVRLKANLCIRGSITAPSRS